MVLISGGGEEGPAGPQDAELAIEVPDAGSSAASASLTGGGEAGGSGADGGAADAGGSDKAGESTGAQGSTNDSSGPLPIRQIATLVKQRNTWLIVNYGQ